MICKMSTVLCLAMLFVVVHESSGQANQAAANAAFPTDKKIGQPNFNIQGGGAGNNGRNWGAGGTVGLGTKVWESKNGRASVGVGAGYSQSFGRHNGQSYHSKPDVGVGAGFRYKFGK